MAQRRSRAPTSPPVQEVEWRPAEPVTFWFARHGQSEYNVEDRIGGDSSITAKGQRFADALPALFGRVLQAAGEDPRFISVWTSTLLRTIETASKLPLPQVRGYSLSACHAAACRAADVAVTACGIEAHAACQRPCCR